jgi:hypothetical protein
MVAVGEGGERSRLRTARDTTPGHSSQMRCAACAKGSVGAETREREAILAGARGYTCVGSLERKASRRSCNTPMPLSIYLT